MCVFKEPIKCKIDHSYVTSSHHAKKSHDDFGNLQRTSQKTEEKYGKLMKNNNQWSDFFNEVLRFINVDSYFSHFHL